MTEHPLTGRTILVVDDSPYELSITSKILSTAGAQIITATCTMEAMQIIRDTTIHLDAIVTDNYMPLKPNGDIQKDEGIRLIKTVWLHELRNVPIILTSSAHVMSDVFARYQLSDFVHKDERSALLVHALMEVRRADPN